MLIVHICTPTTTSKVYDARFANHRFAIEIGQCSTIHVSRDNRLCHFCSYTAIDNKTRFVWACSLCNPKREKYQSVPKNVLLRRFKHLCQLEHQVDISLYPTEVPPSSTPRNDLVWNHCVVLLVPQAFWPPRP